MFRAIGEGDFAQAQALANEAHATGRRFHDRDLIAMSTCAQGRVAIYAGRFAEGLAQLDDAMVRVISGETSPVIAGHVYCTAIEGAQEISDFGRVAEWTAALERWCEAQPGLLAFTGQCAVHRGQLLRLRGAWDDALREYSRAAERYVELGTPGAIGLTAVETGDLLRLRGDLAGADAAYRRAADLGVDPQPGLALLWLAERSWHGRPGRRRAPAGRARRPRPALSPAACGDRGAAGLGPRRPGATAGGGALVTGLVGRLRRALRVRRPGDGRGRARRRRRRRAPSPTLRRAHQLWAQASSPYDGAVVPPAHRPVPAGARRRVVGRARAVGRAIDPAPAGRDAAGRPRLVPARPGIPPDGLTAREVEVLRLVAAGRSNAQIAAELVLSEKTVARHLSNIFGKLERGLADRGRGVRLRAPTGLSDPARPATPDASCSPP